MSCTISRRRRIGVAAAVLLPLGILVQGLSQVDAQFPKGGGMPQPPIGPGFNPPRQNPPGFNPGQNPPGFNPPGQGFNPPMGPKQPFGGNKTYEWRCSKCKAVIATTNSPFNPGVSDCPRCGVHFINGGGGLLPPPNLPMNNGPPAGAAPPNGPPGGMQPPNGPAPGFQPPNAPPAGFQPPAGPGIGFAPPADVAPPNAAPGGNPAVANECKWCSGPAAEGSRYCTGCKVKMGGVLLAGTILVLGVVLIPVALLGWFLVRGGDGRGGEKRRRSGSKA